MEIWRSLFGLETDIVIVSDDLDPQPRHEGSVEPPERVLANPNNRTCESSDRRYG